jgi:hypothetical protein
MYKVIRNQLSNKQYTGCNTVEGAATSRKVVLITAPSVTLLNAVKGERKQREDEE